MTEPLTCIIADDEPAALNQMVRYAEKTPFLKIVGAFNSPLQVLEYLQKNEAPQLILLDIQMPDLTGLELSKVLPPDVMIIFTTAFEQYAISGYKVNAIDYLLKPIDYSEFLTAVTKAKSRAEERTAPHNKPEEDYIFLKSEYHQLKINLSDIIYIEGLKDYVKVYLSTEARPILSLTSLKKLEEKLPPDRFMRIHRSFIVALDKIDHIERSQSSSKTNVSQLANSIEQIFKIF